MRRGQRWRSCDNGRIFSGGGVIGGSKSGMRCSGRDVEGRVGCGLARFSSAISINC